MATNWRQTYEQLKKRKKEIDSAENPKEITKINQKYENPSGRLELPTYTGTGAYIPSKKDDSLFSAFNDGYDFGDISKTILKGGTKLGKAVVNTGKELVTNPVQTVKSFGVGIGSGINKADELINNATDDFFDWIVPGRKEKEDGLTLREFNELSSATDEKTKQKLLKEYEKKYGKDSSQYEMIKLQLEAKPQDKNVLNWKYTDSDTYAKAQAGELSEGQENIYGIGENIGQMLPSVGVSAVASPLAGSGLFFTQSQQSYTEEALARGYDEGEARTYGLIMGGAEVLVERLGFDELGGLQKLSNSSIKKAMVGEGLEEFVMPYIDDVVTYTGFEDGYGWEEFGESSEEALEGAVMGATVGVIMSAGGRGLQKVDNVINKINSGQEITQEDLVQAGKEIQENEPQLLEEAMKQVPAVAREQLEAQKNDVTNEDVALPDDIAPVIEQLEQDNIPIQQAGEQDIAPTEMPQQASEQELKRQNYVSEAKETDSTYRKNLNEDASKYANNTKRTHEFVNTLSNISEATGENIRLTNNTSEEMVARRDQLINNYAKKKNISVEEATSKLKNTIIDAYNTGDGITINVNSPKALNRLVGHEITHSLEKTNEYSKLQKIAIEYAQTKQDYSDRVDVLESLYDGTNANIKNELTSDIVGDYLFTDQEFVNHLQKSDQNIFQKIYSEIKHLIKMATAGSKEARQLEQLKHSFEKAMAEHKASKTNKVTVRETKTKLATETESNTQEKAETVQEIETDETSKVSENVETETKIEDNAKEETTIEEEFSLSVDNKGRKLTEAQEEFFEDSVVRDENGNLLTMYHGTSSGGYTVFDPYGGRPGLFGQGSYFTADSTVAESYTEKGRGSNKQIYEVYLNITKPIDMDGQANVEEWKQYFSKHIPEATFPESGTNEELYRFTLEEFENTEYDRFEVAEIMIETFQKMGYDGITHIGGGRFNQKDETRHRVYITFDSNQVKDVTNKQPTQDDDIRYSLSETTTDNQGRELSKEQQEYFKDSKVRDAEDRLLTVYHGTNNDFTIFDKDFIGKNTNNEGIFGKGFYFTEKKSLADGYNRKDGKVAKDGSGKTMELYLDMKNPFYWNDIDTKEKMESFIKETGMPKYVVRWNNTLKNQMAPITDIKAERKFSDVLQKNGYDGVIYKYEEGVGEYVVFNSNQIKNVDNTNPTESDDIRYSLTRASDEQVKQATELEKQDKTPEEIYLETGAYRGSEGMWRTEIDDSRATITISSAMVGGKYKLSEILNFPKLYKAYPEFKHITVIFDNNMSPNTLGKYNIGANTLTINSSIYDYKQAELLSAKKQLADWDNTVKTYEVLFSGEQIDQHLKTLKKKAKQYKGKDYQKELKSVLLHEIQHVIQETEGFSQGTSESYWKDHQELAKRWKDAHRKRMQKLQDKMGYTDFLQNDLMPRAKEMTVEEIEQERKNFLENSEYAQEYKDLLKMMETSDKRYEILTGRSAYELYRDTAGEEEARDVQDRMEWSSEDRKRFMPYTGGRQTVFYEGLQNEEKYGVILNQTDDSDIRYSLSEDNQGNELKPAVKKWSENSKARDENGQLKVLYHGTATGEFTVFDKNKANPEGDWGAGFYLTDSDFDVENNYEDGGADFDNKVSRLAEQIEQEEDISYEEAKTKAREQLYKGSYKISAYVNIENPAIVGETYLFSDYSDNYNIEDFESEEEYYEAVDQLVADDIDSAIWEIEKQYDFYNGTDEIRNLLWEAYSDGGMEIQTLKDRLGELYLETDEGLVGHDVARIIIESLGYDGIIDPTVSTKWNMDMEEGTTHYIVFKPNQIKNISNENPTDNPDINMSLSRTDQDIAPVKDADVFGSDIALQEAIAPLQEKVEELAKVITDLQENIAPASFELAEEQRAETQRTMSDEDAPLTDEGTFQFLDEAPIEVKNKRDITYDIQNVFNIKHTEAREIYNKIASMPELSVEDIYAELEKHKQVKVQEQDDYYKDIQNYIKGTKLDVSEIKNQIADYDNTYRMANMGKGLTLANSGQSIDSFYQELNELYPNVFPYTVTAEADQLDLISQVMFRDTNLTYTETLDDDTLQILAEKLYSEVGNRERYKSAEAHMTNWFRHYRDMLAPGEEAPIKTEASQTEYLKSLDSGLSDDYAPYLEMAREINASNTEQTAENVSIKDELNRLDTMKAQEEKASENEPKIEKTVYEEMMENFISQVKGDRAKTPVQRVGKSKWRNFRDTTQRLFVNEMVETDNLAKETGNKNIKFKGDMLNSVAGEIEGEINTAQTDNYGHAVGKSLNGLFAPAKQSGLEEAFNHYLELQSNIDRHAQGKGSKVSLLESETLVKEYEKSYPQFKEWGKDVWNYGKNIRDNLVEAGLIDQEFSDRLGDMYPHYVPYIENRDVSNYYPDLGEMKAKSVIKRAKGGASNLLPIEEALTRYTFASKKAVRQNQFYQEIVNTLEDKVMVGADIRSDATDLETSLYRDETGNYLTAYFDGKQQSVRISDDLYNGMKNDLKHQIEGLEEKFALVTDPLQKISEVRRNLLTSWNPMFMIRNPIMDVQDAVFNSKYSKDFIKHYNIKTFIELGKANTETARQFLTLYGSGNAMGEFSSDGTVKNSNFLKGIQRANNIVELAPRFAEFKASLDNGASIQEAMYNSREVTTNFSRGGTITKALNKNGFTFLNVSVQGFDKFIRNFSGENGAKGVVSAVGKATLLGVLPAIFNELVFSEDDDEEYEALPDYIKDNYYIIKTGDGEFIRIPKGRILSVFGSAGRRTLEYLRGEEDAFEGFLKNANTQVGIPNPLDSNIFTPLIQAYGSENGEAWYGGDLVPSRLQDKAPEEQYDASTDKMSIWLGEKLGISPYKLNYVIDQYSGGIGDIFLPFVTEEATSDSEGAGMILAPFKDQFTANSTFDNKYASEIYTLSDEMDKLPSTTKETDEYKIQDAYLYSVTSEMGKLYAERREVQADSNLTKAEKYAKVQAIQEQINSLAKEGMENYQNISKTDVYAIVGGREFNKYTTDDGTERWGSVFEDVLNDLNSMGMDLDEKSEYFRATKTISTIQDSYRESDDYAGKKRDVIGAIKDTFLTGEQKAYLFDKYYGNSDVVNAMVTLDVDIDSYLDYESQNFEADKDASGKSISGSKKAKVFAYINSMNIDFEQRVILAKLQYPSYNEYNGEIIEYLNNSDMTYEQEVVFLEKLGFRVDEDGNIFW